MLLTVPHNASETISPRNLEISETIAIMGQGVANGSNHAQYCLFLEEAECSGGQSKNGQFPTAGVAAFMDKSCAAVTAALYIEMRALPAIFGVIRPCCGNVYY
jgi:hypothetical protein